MAKKTIPKTKQKAGDMKAPDRAMRKAIARAAAGGDINPRKCIGHSNVYTDKTCREKVYDPETGAPLKKPCERDAMLGQNVCATHGGQAPQAKAAAERRLAGYVDRFADRLIEIAEQGMSYPAALGATIQGLKINKIIKEKAETGGSTAPIIKIGIQFGHMATAQTKITGQLALASDNPVEAEIIDDTESG